jgi:glycosidase
MPAAALVDALHDAGMHVIFDIVLNHTGDVFAYAPNPNDPLCTSTNGTQASFSPSPLAVQWRDAHGVPQAGWPVIEQIANPPRDALVWPEEIQKNAYLRRQGTLANWHTTAGDFMALKQILTTDLDLQNALIRIYQHVVAKFDVDGFRIDTPSTCSELRADVLQRHPNSASASARKTSSSSVRSTTRATRSWRRSSGATRWIPMTRWAPTRA